MNKETPGNKYKELAIELFFQWYENDQEKAEQLEETIDILRSKGLLFDANKILEFRAFIGGLVAGMDLMQKFDEIEEKEEKE